MTTAQQSIADQVDALRAGMAILLPPADLRLR